MTRAAHVGARELVDLLDEIRVEELRDPRAASRLHGHLIERAR